MRRAFFRGFMVGSDDERAGFVAMRRGQPVSPYRLGAARTWWERGRIAGEKET